VPRAAGGGALTARVGGRQHKATDKLRERERLVAHERAAAQAEERWLRVQRARLAAEKQRMGASRLEEEVQRAAVAASERSARERQKAAVEAEARAQRERQKAERLRGERLALPRYWQSSLQSAASWALRCTRSAVSATAISGARSAAACTCRTLVGSGAGATGRDQAECGRYLRLELAREWRIENLTMWSGGLANKEAALADPLFRS
jgi:hypothetical protein